MPAAPRLQELPASAAHCCLRIRDFLHHDLGVDLQGATLVLAVSGGGDSMALLAMLTALKPLLGHAMRVAHMDHGLRAESAGEALMVARLCDAWDIPCVIRRADVAAHAAAHRMGLEEAGRHLRYAMLEEERHAHDAAWICTGHHSGDLEEDILLRLLRGTGWPALGGMRALDQERRLLRPLLLTAPDALKDFLRVCDISWAEDASNADRQFKRNRLRHDCLPLLRQESPGLRDHMRHLWSMAQDDAAHWDNLLDSLWAEHQVQPVENTLALPSALLCQCDRATRMRLYLRALRALGFHQVRADIMFRLDAAWTENRGGTRFQLPGGVLATLRRRTVIFSQDRRRA